MSLRAAFLRLARSTGQPYAEIGGLRALVVDEAEAERASFVVCATEGHFPDDIHTVCAECGRAIVHRPHAPKTPPKICMRCMMTVVARRQS